MKDYSLLKDSFIQQSDHFNEYMQVSNKNECSLKALKQINWTGKERVLELGAGTCAFGSQCAPLCYLLVEFDYVKEMLNAGKKLNDSLGNSNVIYETGNCEELPYEDHSFDVIITRQMFHHIINYSKVIKEMERVVKKGGLLVILDIEATDENSRELRDHLETLRDPSHIKILSEKEYLNELHGQVTYLSHDQLSVKFSDWLDLTDPDEQTRKQLWQYMHDDLDGKITTGFQPYLENDEVYFIHTWITLIVQY